MGELRPKNQQGQQRTMQQFMGGVLKRIEETPKTDSRAEARGTVAAEAVGPRDAGQHPTPMRSHVPEVSPFVNEPSPFVTTVSSSSRQAPGGNPWDSATEPLGFGTDFGRISPTSPFQMSATAYGPGGQTFGTSRAPHEYGGCAQSWKWAQRSTVFRERRKRKFWRRPRKSSQFPL